MRMARLLLAVTAACCLFLSASGFCLADTYYVWANSLANGPGTAWSNAFRDIQSAVDVASDGDTVLVTNGVYSTGSRITPGYTLMNRLVLTNDIAVRSMNGPSMTLILGAGPLGSNAIRCVYMTDGILSGFAVTNGHTRIGILARWNRHGNVAVVTETKLCDDHMTLSIDMKIVRLVNIAPLINKFPFRRKDLHAVVISIGN